MVYEILSPGYGKYVLVTRRFLCKQLAIDARAAGDERHKPVARPGSMALADASGMAHPSQAGAGVCISFINLRVNRHQFEHSQGNHCHVTWLRQGRIGPLPHPA